VACECGGVAGRGKGAAGGKASGRILSSQPPVGSTLCFGQLAYAVFGRTSPMPQLPGHHDGKARRSSRNGRKLMRTLVALGSSAFALLCLGSVSEAFTWQRGYYRWCHNVCQNRPVVSGHWRGTYPYWLCSANHGGEGWRPGYQLQTHSYRCVVGYGGREVAESKYYCGCL
jgi:hypothetical protein